MTEIHQRALRILVSMQVAVIEHRDEDITVTVAIKALEDCNRAWQKIVKELSKL